MLILESGQGQAISRLFLKYPDKRGYTINGENISATNTVVPGDWAVTVIQSTNGKDLTCRVNATMTPTRGTTGLSADWLFEAEQY